MQRYLDFVFRGKQTRLYFSMSVMLDVQEAFDVDMRDFFTGTDREVFDRKMYLLSALSYEGKRIFQERELEGITLTELESVMPYEMIEINEALDKALELGFTREFQPEEVDEGLAELKKKKKVKNSQDHKLSEQENS